jgi:hypothetical protein
MAFEAVVDVGIDELIFFIVVEHLTVFVYEVHDRRLELVCTAGRQAGRQNDCKDRVSEQNTLGESIAYQILRSAERSQRSNLHVSSQLYHDYWTDYRSIGNKRLPSPDISTSSRNNMTAQ